MTREDCKTRGGLMTPGPCLGTECPEAPLCAAREEALQRPEKHEGYCHHCNNLGTPLDEQGFHCGVCCDGAYGPCEYEPIGGWRAHIDKSNRNLRIGNALRVLADDGKLDADEITRIREAVKVAMARCTTCGWPKEEGQPHPLDPKVYRNSQKCPECEWPREVFRADEGTQGFVPPAREKTSCA